jgi:D-alanine-D-alanine ligase
LARSRREVEDMKVLITYNAINENFKEDYLCHFGVMDAVKSVGDALVELGYSFTTLGIGDDISCEIGMLMDTDADVVFNLCESINGKSTLQPAFAGALELLGIPFTGSGSGALTLAIDKRKTKAMLRRNGVPTPTDWVLDSIDDVDFPVIVKPAMEDGSIGIEQSSIAENKEELDTLIRDRGRKYGHNLLIEDFISGREFYVGLLGNEPPIALPVAEIKFRSLPDGYRNIMSYQVKWEEDSLEKRAFHRDCPAEVDEDLRKRLIDVATRAYNAIELRGYGRVDIRADGEGNPYVIDVNANPDITSGQGYPLIAQIGGISYPELIRKLIDYAFKRK